MHRVSIGVFPWTLLAGEALAHSGHDAPALHIHGWEAALLATVIASAAIAWFRARK